MHPNGGDEASPSIMYSTYGNDPRVYWPQRKNSRAKNLFTKTSRRLLMRTKCYDYGNVKQQTEMILVILYNL